MTSTIKILSTKKLQWHQKTDLLNKRFSLIEIPFIDIKLQEFEWILSDVIIITSSNALESLIRFHKNSVTHQVFWCVGQYTKQNLESNGYIVEHCFDYAKELNHFIINNHQSKSFLWLRGNLTTQDLTKEFEQSEIIWQEKIVYQTALNPQLVDEPVDAILFYSPSGVDSFFKYNTVNHQICFCIGQSTARALKQYHSKASIITPKNPTVLNLTQAVVNFNDTYPTIKPN